MTTLEVWLVIAVIISQLGLIWALIKVRQLSYDKEKAEKLEGENALLRIQVLEDPLTGLYNRRHFDRVLAEEVQKVTRYEVNSSLIVADFDYFKEFNDSKGHEAGDEALRTVARLMKSQVRVSDIAARIGGDEFAFILTHTELSEAEIVAEKLLEAVRAEKHSVSVGVTQIRPGTSPLSQADGAMYEAKRAGRNCYRSFKA